MSEIILEIEMKILALCSTLVLLAACQTSSITNQKIAALENNINDQISSDAHSYNLKPLDANFHIKLQPNSSSHCTREEGKSYPLVSKSDFKSGKQAYKIIENGIFSSEQHGSDGTTISATANTSDDGVLIDMQVNITGTALNEYSREEITQAENFIGKYIHEKQFAGQIVSNGSNLYYPGIHKKFMLEVLRSADSGAQLSSFKDDTVVKGISIIDDRKTLIAEGKSTATAFIRGIGISATIEGFVAIDIATGLVKKWVAKTVGKAGPTSYYTAFSKQECSITK